MLCVFGCACRWRNVEFVVKRVKAAKDNFILGEVDDVMQVRVVRQPQPRGVRGGGCRIAARCPYNENMLYCPAPQVLEDSKITVSMILSSRYVGGIK